MSLKKPIICGLIILPNIEIFVNGFFDYFKIKAHPLIAIRNLIKYIPSKDYKKFTQSLKKVYGAPSLQAYRKAFELFVQEWSQYPRAVDVWKRNFPHVEQLFEYRKKHDSCNTISIKTIVLFWWNRRR